MNETKLRGYVRYFGNSYAASLYPKKTRVRAIFKTGGGRAMDRTVAINEGYGTPRVQIDQASADYLARKLTAFSSLRDMADTEPGYRPTILERDAEHVLLADAYDRYQEHRGDPRRAYRGRD